MDRTADAVVIGGGIAGASVGHFLAKKKFGKVVVVEKRKLAAVGTGHSAANIRTYYSNPITVQLAKRALEMFENDRELLGGDCLFRQVGFLLLLDEKSVDPGKHILALQKQFGIEIRDVSLSDIKELAPQLVLDHVARGIYEPRSGYTDPIRTTCNLVEKAKQWGLTCIEGVGATGIRLEGNRVTAVETEDGRISTGVVINAAGPWGPRVGSWIGLKYSLRWSRESDLFVKIPDGFGPIPVVSDTYLRFYFRPHGDDEIMAGLGAPKEIEPLDIDNCDPSLDAKTRQRIEQPLFKRVPALAKAQFLHGYSSMYDITDDWNTIVGPEPDIHGYFAFFGGSGHGYKLSPPIGEALADVIAGDVPRIDIHPLRPSRFIEGEPLSSAWGGGNRG